MCHPERSRVGCLSVIQSGAAQRAAQSKDLYFNFDDIRIEIPRQARDDRRVLSLGRLGMTEGGTLPFRAWNVAAADILSPTRALRGCVCRGGKRLKIVPDC